MDIDPVESRFFISVDLDRKICLYDVFDVKRITEDGNKSSAVTIPTIPKVGFIGNRRKHQKYL